MAATYDYYWGSTATSRNWTNHGNTINDIAFHSWRERLRGPGYRVAECTLILTETADHKPERFAHIAGVQFKRVTRRGEKHYYRAIDVKEVS